MHFCPLPSGRFEGFASSWPRAGALALILLTHCWVIGGAGKISIFRYTIKTTAGTACSMRFSFMRIVTDFFKQCEQISVSAVGRGWIRRVYMYRTG